MIRNDLPGLQPVSTTGPNGEAAMLVDEAASPEALYLEADSRLTAAHGMLFTAALTGNPSAMDGRDVANIAQAAQILVSDGLDLLRALNEAHERAAKRQRAQHPTRHQEP